MSDWVIYHNPRCGKSRLALELLEDEEVEPEIVLYLKTSLDETRLADLTKMLGIRPRELVRTNENIFREINLDLEDDAAVLRAMAENPILMERPVVVHGTRAVIGRPPSKVLELL